VRTDVSGTPTKNLFLFLAASWITLFGILIAGTYSVNLTANVTKNGLRNSLSSLAKSFAVALKDAGHHNVLLETPQDNSQDNLYWKLVHMMSTWQQEIPTVASIYTFRQNDKGLTRNNSPHYSIHFRKGMIH